MSSGKWKLKQQFCISIRMAKIQNPDNTNCWQRCGVSGTLIHCWQEHKVVQPFWSSVRQALHKAQHAPTIWSSNCSLCYLPKRAENLHPQEKERNLHMDVYSSCIYNCWNLKATKLSFSKRRDTVWYTQTMEYYSAPKRNGLAGHEETWGIRKCISLSERSQF